MNLALKSHVMNMVKFQGQKIKNLSSLIQKQHWFAYRVPCRYNKDMQYPYVWLEHIFKSTKMTELTRWPAILIL